MPLVANILFTALVLLAAGSDLAKRRISNRLNLVILLAGVASRLLLEGPYASFLGILGAVVGLALLLPPFAARWIGGGDVKLMAALGAWLGPMDAVWVCLIGLVGGGLLSALMTLAFGAQFRKEVWGNLSRSMQTMSSPVSPRRSKNMVVPLAVPYAAAALLVFWGLSAATPY